MIEIIVADDHAIVRQGLQMMLSDIPDMNISDQAETGSELLNKLSSGKFDLIILDICMPGMDIFELLEKLKILGNTIPILILSMNPEKIFARRLLKAGVNGYVNKSAVPEEIIDAIRKTVTGEIYLSPDLAGFLAAEYVSGTNEKKHESLSEREFQVFNAIAKGKSLTEIAGEFFISKSTVSNHRTSIMKKMDLRNNSEIIQYAIKNHLI